ncbi:MAG: aminoacyl-tRNA hydrolase [Candidatus Omnitrophica bacterium]|nr:aminoacyl-tRNA hydrolase [Candidatus Omnitrophota bacterium]
MKLIVGLGNPGLRYAGSRHNIGFAIVKSLACSLKVAFKRDRLLSSLVGRTVCGGEELVLALPQTFMNLSGVAVKALLRRFKLDPRDILVVCDDLDLELGRIRLRRHGSSVGQRGMKSIIEQLGTQEFSRLRLGIGRPRSPEDTSRYVLSGFLRKERNAVEEAKEEAVRCCLRWVQDGINATMDNFNDKPVRRAGGNKE